MKMKVSCVVVDNCIFIYKQFKSISHLCFQLNIFKKKNVHNEQSSYVYTMQYSMVFSSNYEWEINHDLLLVQTLFGI